MLEVEEECFNIREFDFSDECCWLDDNKENHDSEKTTDDLLREFYRSLDEIVFDVGDLIHELENKDFRAGVEAERGGRGNARSRIEGLKKKYEHYGREDERVSENKTASYSCLMTKGEGNEADRLLLDDVDCNAELDKMNEAVIVDEDRGNNCDNLYKYLKKQSTFTKFSAGDSDKNDLPRLSSKLSLRSNLPMRIERRSSCDIAVKNSSSTSLAATGLDKTEQQNLKRLLKVPHRSLKLKPTLSTGDVVVVSSKVSSSTNDSAFENVDDEDKMVKHSSIPRPFFKNKLVRVTT